MTDKDQIKSLMGQIRSSAKNLSQDIDQNSPREETQDDLEQLSLSFQDLREMLANMTQEDSDNLNREFRELLSGEEDFQTYIKDVKKILFDVKNRIKSDKKTEEKIANNLPEDQQHETPTSLMQGFSGLMDKLANWTEKAGSR